ncbi:hypothetical protein PENTCL1PPCAC_27758, partial [Pristionchus entomophagus]
SRSVGCRMSGQGAPPPPPPPLPPPPGPNGAGGRSGPPSAPLFPTGDHLILPHAGLPGFTADPFGMDIASLPFEQLAAQLNLQLQQQAQLQQAQQQAAQLHAQQQARQQAEQQQQQLVMQQHHAIFDQAAVLQAAQAAVAQQKHQVEQQQQLQQQHALLQQVHQLQHQQAHKQAAAAAVAAQPQPQLAQAKPVGGHKTVLPPAAVQHLQQLQATHKPRPRASKEEYVGVQCHICGAAADGMHYRAISCRSCNAFFRRAVSYEHDYVCRFGGNCNVSVQGRCACRACRYRKCVEAGMLKTCVQPSRDPTGSQKDKKKKEEASPGAAGAAGAAGPGGPAPRQPRGQANMTAREIIREQQIRDGAGTSGHNARMMRGMTEEEPDVDIVSIVSVASTPQSQQHKPKGAPRSPRKPPVGRTGVAAAAARLLEEKRLADMKMEIEDDNVDAAIQKTIGDDEEEGGGRIRKKRFPPINRPWDLERVGGGYAKFERLVSCYHEHLRLMQLAMTPIESFLKQFETGIKLREMHPNDVSLLSTTELSGLLYWIEKQDPYSELPPEDRRALFKRYSVRKLSLDHFYNASKWTDEVKKDNFVMLNNTFVPPNKTGFELATDDEKQITAKAEIFLPTFEQMWRCVIRPFNRMQITDAEMVFLHTLLLWSPLNNTHVLDPTKPIMKRQREWAIAMLFEHYEIIGQEDPDVRFGEVCSLLAEVEVICDKHCQDFQVAKLFEFCDMSQFWYEKWCYSAVNTMQVPAAAAASPMYTNDGETAEEMLDKELEKVAALNQGPPSCPAPRMKRDQMYSGAGGDYVVPEKKAAFDRTPSAPSTTPSTPTFPGQ